MDLKNLETVKSSERGAWHVVLPPPDEEVTGCGYDSLMLDGETTWPYRSTLGIVWAGLTMDPVCGTCLVAVRRIGQWP